ncbi:MAG: hypothetical protein IKZ49_00155 [Alphaproteobacteria bacterium]|nr:hypothetical protein [Alphaproteobacteria bacterium]
MRKRIYIFALSLCLFATSVMAESDKPERFINKSLYKNVYPSTINNTKPTPLKTNTLTSTTGNTKSMNTTGKRRVVKRNTRARAATNNQPQPNSNRRVVQRKNVARSASNNNRNMQPRKIGNTSTSRTNPKRNVVARSASSNNSKLRVRSATNKTDANATYKMNAISSQRCFADYKECMERYCKQENTAYNRCYCSAKLAQIDEKYQSKIDSLAQQIIKLQYNTNVTSDEIKEYWDNSMGQYTGTNPWVNIDNALNIKWADMESRVRGQNAFATGHQYCVNHLRSCSSMSSNMRDAYKSEISRDCAAYESSLQKIQNAAESVIESYGND